MKISGYYEGKTTHKALILCSGKDVRYLLGEEEAEDGRELNVRRLWICAEKIENIYIFNYLSGNRENCI